MSEWIDVKVEQPKESGWYAAAYTNALGWNPAFFDKTTGEWTRPSKKVQVLFWFAVPPLPNTINVK